MAVFPDRLVLKNSADSEATIITAIGSGGADPIVQGEVVVGVEATDAGLYTLDQGGNVIKIASSYASGRAIVSDTEPTAGLSGGALQDGDLWYKGDTGRYYVYDTGAFVLVSGTVGSYGIDDLTDVDTTTTPPTDGQALIWNNVNGEWVPGDVSVAQSLDDLTDVDLTSTPPVSNDVLVYNGTNWVPGSQAASIDDLTDVDTTTSAPANGEVLAWDGTNWVPTANSVTSNSIDDLTDVDTSTVAPSNGETLVWDGANWVPGTSSSVSSLDDLTDVDLTTTPPIAGQVLKYDGFNWFPGTDVKLSSIDELSDVDTTTVAPTDRQALMWDGSDWVPSDRLINDLGDVNTSAGSGDNNYNSVSFLLLGSAFTDSGPNALTVTPVNQVAVDTINTKFGNGSYDMGGSSSIIDIAYNSANDLTAGDWTIEFWIERGSDPEGYAVCTDRTYNGAGLGNDWYVFMAQGYVRALCRDASGTAVYRQADIPWLDSTWQHFAVVRTGDTLKFYKDGNEYPITAGSGGATPTGDLDTGFVGSRSGTTNVATVGAGRNSFGSIGFHMNSTNIEGVRVTKGVARYTGSTYTVPVAEFPTSAGTVLLDGDVLTWDDTASEWVPQAPAPGGANALGDLTDVDTTTTPPTDGQSLVWDNANSQWEPGTVTGGATSIDGLTDVDTTTVPPTDGQALVWDNANSQWEPGTVSGSGAVDSVNGQTGVVVLDADDIDDTSTTHKFTTAGDISKLAGIEAGAEVNDPTNLSYTAATRVLASSTGTDATLPEVVAAGDSGLMTGADKTKLDGITAGAEPNVATDLTYTASTRVLASSTGTDATLPEVVAAGDSGLMTGADKTKLDGIDAGAQVNVATDLSNTPAASTVSVESSTGTNTTLPAATATLAGVMTGADKTKLDGIDAGAEVNVGTDLTYTASTRVLASSTGTNATLPEVVASGNSGLITGADKAKLDGITAGAEPNVDTDLTYTASTRLLESSTGTDVTLPEVVASGNSGLITGADKAKLDGISPGAEVNAVDSVAGKTGVVTLVKADITDFSDADYATAAQGTTADSAVQPTDSIDVLSDVDTTTVAPTDGQALVWDNANSQWEPGDIASAGLAKAWVEFNGTSTLAVNSSYNVSSVTDNGVGNYTVNYTTAMSSANHCVNATMNLITSLWYNIGISAASTTDVTVRTRYNSSYFDANRVSISVFD